MPEKAKLRAVLFDLDDTLYSTSSFAALARHRAVEAMVEAGLEVSVEEARAELEEVVHEFSSNYSHHYEKLLLRFPGRLRAGVHWAVVVAAGVVAYHDTKSSELKPFPDAGRAIKGLKAMNLLLGVVSDGITVKQAEKLVRLGLSDAFSPDAIFISEDMGVSKPNPKLFKMASKRIGVEPKEVLYVGDNPQNDIDPAHEAGMWTCLRRGSGKYASHTGRHSPDIETRDLGSLPDVVRDLFDVGGAQ
ncbi:MAG: TIGR02253 family HAD-type hydrolase [Planctomycetota bacterium]|nr:TIGR02253 family HAD-type hydrolase [Planctomycetota bacterium]